MPADPLTTAMVGAVEDVAAGMGPDDAPALRTAAERVVLRLLLGRLRGVPVAEADPAGLLEADHPVDADHLARAEARLAALPREAIDLGAAHEAVLARVPVVDPGTGRLTLERSARNERRTSGTWYTPAPLVDLVLDATLDPVLADMRDPLDVRVCDPAVGAAAFLVAAGRWIAARTGAPIGEVVGRCLFGVDLDPVALAVARAVLWLEAPDDDGLPDRLLTNLRVGNSLMEPDPSPADAFDVVVGNPPFLSPLREGARVSPERRLVKERAGGLGGPKADESTYFLLRSARLRRPGGRVGLVLPDSFLSAADSADVRRALAADHDLALVWRGDGSEFAASVTTTVVVLSDRGAAPVPERRIGPAFAPLPATDLPWREGSWAPLVAEQVGALLVRDRGRTPGPTLGDLCEITADYRDQYYGLRGRVVEAEPDHEPSTGRPLLVTTGLVDPLTMRWGAVPARYDKVRYERPVVEVERLDEPMRRWADSRLRPKVLVATQGRLPEAVADHTGHWLPCVPVLTVVPKPSAIGLDEVVAVLTSPPVHDYLRATRLGAGLGEGALKVSAADLRDVPAPTDLAVLPAAAAALRDALDDPGRLGAYVDLVHAAYGIDRHDTGRWDAAFAAYRVRR